MAKKVFIHPIEKELPFKLCIIDSIETITNSDNTIERLRLML